MLKKHQQLVDMIEKKISLIKDLKSVFLLERINYRMLREMWMSRNGILSVKDVVEVLSMDSAKEEECLKDLNEATEMFKDSRSFEIEAMLTIKKDKLALFHVDMMLDGAEF